VIDDVDRWLEEGEPVVMATVVSTWGSSPRPAGAKMAMTASGRIAGSVSGGCVEGAVFDVASEVLAGGPPQLLHFGVADETAWNVGLACGGSIDVFVEPLQPAAYRFARDLLAGDAPFATATVIAGPGGLLGRGIVVQRSHTFGGIAPELDQHVAAIAHSALAAGATGRHSLRLPDSRSQPIELFVEISQPSPQLIMVGGVQIAIALASFAKTLGYRTIVVDPRRAFGARERFPHVDQLIRAWPEVAFAGLSLTPGTAVALLTHDPKIDDPALRIALRSPAFYVGALGSRKTHEARKRRLASAGVPAESIDRIHGPIGVEIGARTPEEIALAIMAQIVAVRARQAEASPAAISAPS
jgi:xanthine dehydrogenase accessory factor